MQDEIRQQIANDLGIAALPPEQQNDLISQFGQVALKAATMAIVEKLPEGKRQEFATLAGSGDPAALQQFLDAELPDHDQIAKQAVAAEIQRFKDFQAA